MKIKMGQKVVTENGENIGKIERVVIDPKTEEITHVVIRKGFLFTKDRVVPVGMLGAATDEGMTLRASKEEIKMLPEFETDHYLLYGDINEAIKPQSGYATPIIMYPPSGFFQAGTPSPSYPNMVHHIDKNIPTHTVAIKRGADVFGLDGKKVGDVEEVFIDPELDCVTYFLVSEGLLLKGKKLIPVAWLDEASEDRLTLAVDTKIVQQLPDYPRGVPEKE